MLLLDRIVIDPAIQCRVTVSKSTVDAYAKAMADDAIFPPVVVYRDAADVLSDGFQRCAAAKQAGRTKILAEIRSGSRRDALLNAASANLYHGLQPNRADKMRAVMALLSDEEWGKWSDREIGRRCGVDGKTVAAARENSQCGNSALTRAFTTRHGTVGHRRLAPRSSDASSVTRKRHIFSDSVEELEHHDMDPSAAVGLSLLHALHQAVDALNGSKFDAVVSHCDDVWRRELAANLRRIADLLIMAS